MCPSDEQQAKAIADLVEKYLWDKLGVIFAKGIYGQELNSEIRSTLNNKNIKVTTSQSFERGAKRMTKQISNVSRTNKFSFRFFSCSKLVN